MKKIILLALASCFALTACTGGNYSSKDNCGRCAPKPEKVCGCDCK